MNSISNLCQELLDWACRKDIILLLDASTILYVAGSFTDVEDRHAKLTLSAGDSSIDDFNTEVKVAVWQQR